MWFNLSQFIIFKDGLPFGILMTQKVDSFQNHLDLASSMKKRLHSSQKMSTLQIIYYLWLALEDVLFLKKLKLLG